MIKDFGTITLKEDTTLSANISFEDTTDPGKPDPAMSNTGNDDSGDEAGLGLLPNTGGDHSTLGVLVLGAVLLAGGLLARRLGH